MKLYITREGDNESKCRHVVANRVSNPLTYCITSLPPSFDSPYTRSTKVIGT